MAAHANDEILVVDILKLARDDITASLAVGPAGG
jgi:hypothetical protein